MLAKVCRSARCSNGDRSSPLELRGAVTLATELLRAPSCADPTGRRRGSGYWAASDRHGLPCLSCTTPFIFDPRATPREIISSALGSGMCETTLRCPLSQHGRCRKQEGEP